jgi:hypothetical protein
VADELASPVREAAVTSPRDQYDTARRKAQARTPADPQSNVTGGPAALAAVTAMKRPCVTAVTAGTCGHAGYEHATGTRGGRETRTACSIATAAGRCGCRVYTAGPGRFLSLLSLVSFSGGSS